MISRRIFAAVALLCAFSFSVQAQPFTKAQLNSQVGVNFPDNTSFLITPQNARTISDNIINSIMPTAPVVSGNLACFNGTTGLLQDCGVSPSAANITVGTTVITAGTNGRVVFDNAGKVGEYTNTQLTALINTATSSLPGAMPPFPGNTSTAFLGNGTYGAIDLSAGVTGALPNANLAQVGAATFKGNPTASTAAVQDFTIQGLVARGAPDAVNDKIPLYDNAAGTIKYVTPGAIAAAATSGVSSINGTTGAFTTANGVTSSGAVLQTDFTHNNIWTGTNQFHAGAYFGGSPWFDVKSTAQGCAAAVGDGVTDDTAAIQCHINYMATTTGGGIVFFPSNNSCYLVSSTVIDYAGVWLEGGGAGNTNTGIATKNSCLTTNTDITVLQFSFDPTTSGICPGGGHLGGMEKMAIHGFNNSSATTPAVIVGNNCTVTIRDSTLAFGSYGMLTGGVDSYFENDRICGYNGCVISTGANWYVRDILDTLVTPNTNAIAFTQGVYTGPGGSSAAAENHFVQTDMSFGIGVAGVLSVFIDDGSNQSAITHFAGGVFSGGIVLNHMKLTMIDGYEVGSTNFQVNAGTLLMGTSAVVTGTAVTISGAGGKLCAANSNSGFTNC